MLEEYNKRDKNHLFQLIGRRNKETPNFALLIGAGASVTSGIKTSKEMVDEWRRQLHLQSKSDLSVDEWSKDQDWYNNDEEYSILFEEVCDQRSQRRIYIEDCVKDAKPSWGYIYLANIVANNYFNVIFTPNFDDLLNEACFLYADLRPVVCAQDSAVIDVRVTSARPKIIKLHGDFLYDDIKNTVRETESLEKNMRDKFMQFASEYGLVVIGYGGYDRSIMDILYSVLRSGGSFPHGVYWCVRDKNKISKKLKQLMRQENIYWIEIEGFDEFMAELHDKLGLVLPDAVRDPYKSTTEKLNEFIIPTKKVKHDIIKRDIAQLEEQIKIFERVVVEGVSNGQIDNLAPNKFLGTSEFMKGNYENAFYYYEKAFAQRPEIDTMVRIVNTYRGREMLEEALEKAKEIIKNYPEHYKGYLHVSISFRDLNKIDEAIENINKSLNYANNKSEIHHTLLSKATTLLISGDYELALKNANDALNINPSVYGALTTKCEALKRLGSEEEAKNIINSALPEIHDSFTRACAFAIINDKKQMLIELKNSIEKYDLNRIFAKTLPEFMDYKDDPDFKKLISKENVEE